MEQRAAFAFCRAAVTRNVQLFLVIPFIFSSENAREQQDYDQYDYDDPDPVKSETTPEEPASFIICHIIHPLHIWKALLFNYAGVISGKEAPVVCEQQEEQDDEEQ